MRRANLDQSQSPANLAPIRRSGKAWDALPAFPPGLLGSLSNPQWKVSHTWETHFFQHKSSFFASLFI